ncbi:anthranilate synthase component I family protein [Corallococcus sp. ZKHCc1 1396]|uniref:Anthranilate synthase component I family protein n=1 Tax=Corallococcus soli TaxID=2710757 RepID=A0ABR9PJI8_9BACT|nr:anthranilate synthase component I family protein [Corallococcus soli]MBE4748064.1 anthranilate synthase component I family protein [Corallococcus soli]
MAVPASPLPSLDRARFDALVAQGYTQVPLARPLDVGAARPVDLLRALPAGDRFLLESTRTSSEGRYSLLGACPFLRFTARGAQCQVDGVLQDGAPLTVLRGLLRRWKGLRLPGLPLFCGGAVGFFSYEASHFFEALPHHPHDDLRVPDIALHFVDTFLVVDHLEHTVHAVATGADWEDCSRRLDLLASQVRAAVATPPPAPPPPDLPLPAWRSNFTQDAYLLAVERVREYIRAGDTYQVNLSQRLEVDFPGDPLALYETLSVTSPVHFASYFEAESFQVVSASPERLVRVEDGRATTRPIAGTRRRGTPEEDARFVHELRTSEKEQAEHAMLVDLERNDLGRVCAYGTVEVTRLMEIIEYAHVLHIESEVVGQLAPGVEPLDVVGALFPGGTITGVPKLRTMEIITELEPHPRGLYTGSLGYFSFAGGLDLNIVIRTVVVKDGRAYAQVGGGIVHDSEPRREYKETLNKARSQLLALAASTRPR